MEIVGVTQVPDTAARTSEPAWTFDAAGALAMALATQMFIAATAASRRSGLCRAPRIRLPLSTPIL
jgi:hypothetical protein